MTDAKLQAVLEAIKKQFASWIEFGYEPQIIKDFDGSPAIIWEDGAPYEWTMLISGGIEEEFGFSVAPMDEVSGVFVEPYNRYVLSVYDA